MGNKKKLAKQARKQAKSLLGEIKLDGKKAVKSAKKQAKTSLKSAKQDNHSGGKKKVALTAGAFLGAYLVARSLGFFDDDEEYSSSPKAHR